MRENIDLVELLDLKGEIQFTNSNGIGKDQLHVAYIHIQNTQWKGKTWQEPYLMAKNIDIYQYHTYWKNHIM